MFQPQKRPLSPSIKAVSIKASPAKEVVNKFYQNFSCPKCHANISFHGFVPLTKFQIIYARAALARVRGVRLTHQFLEKGSRSRQFLGIYI